MNPNNSDPNNPNPTPPPPPSNEPAPTFPPSDLSSILNNNPQPSPTAIPPQPIASSPFDQTPFNQAPSASPAPDQNLQNPFMSPAPQSTWNPTPVSDPSPVAPSWPQPTPTFTPPTTDINPVPQMPSAAPSNPEPMPTFTAPAPETPTVSQPNSQDFMANMPMSGQTMANPNMENAQSEPNIQSEPAPTDLSHLIPTQNGSEAPVYTPPVTQPETLVVPPDGNGTVTPNIPTEGKTTIPKWMIGLAVGLLLIVSAASAYFILGIGQPQTSKPATQVQQTPTAPPPAVITSAPPVATSSATGPGFGQFQNPTPTSTATGSSAADILRQRLGQ